MKIEWIQAWILNEITFFISILKTPKYFLELEHKNTQSRFCRWWHQRWVFRWLKWHNEGDYETVDGDSQEVAHEENGVEPKNLWVEVISGNRLLVNRLTIEYSEPKLKKQEIEVEIKDDYVESEVQF